MDDLKEATKRKASFFATMKAVFWSFFGVRRKSGYEHDSANLNPIHVIIAGILAAVLFIGVLIAVVRFAVNQSY